MQTQVKEWESALPQSFHHKTLEERAAEFDGKLMLDGEYDWGDPVGKEETFSLLNCVIVERRTRYAGKLEQTAETRGCGAAGAVKGGK